MLEPVAGQAVAAAPVVALARAVAAAPVVVSARVAVAAEPVVVVAAVLVAAAAEPMVVAAVAVAAVAVAVAVAQVQAPAPVQEQSLPDLRLHPVWALCPPQPLSQQGQALLSRRNPITQWRCWRTTALWRLGEIGASRSTFQYTTHAVFSHARLRCRKFRVGNFQSRRTMASPHPLQRDTVYLGASLSHLSSASRQAAASVERGVRRWRHHARGGPASGQRVLEWKKHEVVTGISLCKQVARSGFGS